MNEVQGSPNKLCQGSYFKRVFLLLVSKAEISTSFY